MSKSNPDKNIIALILSTLVVFTFGILIGGAIALYIMLRNSFFVSNAINIQVDPVGIISVILNVILVIYVAGILTRKNEQDRAEKDILMKRLERFESNLEEYISDFFNRTTLELVFVNGRIKTLRQDFKSIYDLLKRYKFVPDPEESCTSIDGGVRDLKDLFTDTPRLSTATTVTTITDNKIVINDEGRQNVEQKKNYIKDQLFDLIVKINRKK